jgi:hypothetical protein
LDPFLAPPAITAGDMAEVTENNSLLKSLILYILII